MLDTAANWVMALAAAFAAWVVYQGLDAWKNEMRGRSEFELSRRILRAVYELRDAIQHVRDPTMLPSEWEDRPGRKPDEKLGTPKDHAFAYEKRWERVREAGSHLDAEMLEAEVLWEDVLEQHHLALRKCVSTLLLNVNRYVRAQLDERHAARFTGAKWNEIHAVIWPTADTPEEDKFWCSVVEAISGFEDTLREKGRDLRPRGRGE